MNRYWDLFIKPALQVIQPNTIIEIGAEAGANTGYLLDFCQQRRGRLHVIDPAPAFDVAAWLQSAPDLLEVHQARSLDALPGIGPADAVLIDGDHNWYTVINELRILAETARTHQAAFPVVFFHDVGWPYGRRDLYYDPDAIPERFRHPAAREGIAPGKTTLVADGGLNAHLWNALHEGGPRNGVLTAIEDFVTEHNLPLELAIIPALQGLAILYPPEPASRREALRKLTRSVTRGARASAVIAATENDRTQWQVRTGTLTQLLARAQARADALENEIAPQRSRSREQEALVQDLNAQVVAERERNAQAEVEIAALRKGIDLVRTALDELESDRASLRSELARERQASRDERARELRQRRAGRARERKLRAESASTRARARLEQHRLKQQIAAEQTAVEDGAYRLAVAAELLPRLRKRLSGKHAVILALAEDQISRAREELTRQEAEVRTLQPDEQPVSPALGDGALRPGRLPSPGQGNSPAMEDSSVDIVVCVHNALQDTIKCLESVVRHTPVAYRIIIVDDGSDEACANWLRSFVVDAPNRVLLRNDEARGYTRAANRGLRHASADLVILLNSDTIVTPGWAERLLECAASDEAIGIVGPLSNVASYQSVPMRFDQCGDWALNPIPEGWDVEQIAATLDTLSQRTFPNVPFINGFCFAIKRAVIDAIGVFDEDAFPDGYGEENDYCLRATDAGFTLALADHAYVYHAKSRSYSHQRRRELGRQGRAALVQRYGLQRLQSAESRLRDDPTLADLRRDLKNRLQSPPIASNGAIRILFLLPVSGGGGGAHSVVQEAAGMRQIGFDAQVAIHAHHLGIYRETYPEIAHRDTLFFAYRSEHELLDHAGQFSVAVATIFTSVELLRSIVKQHEAVMPAYYIQDYEPYFFPEGTEPRQTAAESYARIPGMVHFAKTQWLCDTVHALHGVPVHKVAPSLDHTVYYPSAAKPAGGPVRVVAMVRPRSKRRGPKRTMKTLKGLKHEFGDAVDIQIFGCRDTEIGAADLPAKFDFTNHGLLNREGVAEILRAGDIFLDLSDYQAFGRTGLEAMACGCAVVVPQHGGTGEYARDHDNALIVDTSSAEACLDAARDLVADSALRARLQAAGIQTAAEYSIEAAARSEVELFTRQLASHTRPVPTPRATSECVFQGRGATG